MRNVARFASRNLIIQRSDVWRVSLETFRESSNEFRSKFRTLAGRDHRSITFVYLAEEVVKFVEIQ